MAIEKLVIRGMTDADQELAIELDPSRTITNDKMRMVGVTEDDIEAIQVSYTTIHDPAVSPQGGATEEMKGEPFLLIAIDVMFKDAEKLKSLMQGPSRIIRPN